MEKFTFRDFMVYFLTGLILITTVLLFFPLEVDFDTLFNLFAEKNLGLILFVVPFIYVIGLLFHSIDIVLYLIGKKLHNATKLPENIANTWLHVSYWALGFMLNGHRLSYYHYKNEDTHPNLWVKYRHLKYFKKHKASEYYELLNDLFKGFTLIFQFAFLGAIFIANCTFALIFALSSILSFISARVFASHFYVSVNDYYSILENERPK